MLYILATMAESFTLEVNYFSITMTIIVVKQNYYVHVVKYLRHQYHTQLIKLKVKIGRRNRPRIQSKNQITAQENKQTKKKDK